MPSAFEVQTAPRRFLKVLKPIRVEEGLASGELLPFDGGFRLEVDIEFDHKLIGHQRYAATLSPDVFRRDLARARTFGFMSDVAKLWSAGYARGASLENTICLAEDRVLNPEGLRYRNEFVRHKALDAIGDLSLAGLPIWGATARFVAAISSMPWWSRHLSPTVRPLPWFSSPAAVIAAMPAWACRLQSPLTARTFPNAPQRRLIPPLAPWWEQAVFVTRTRFGSLPKGSFRAFPRGFKG